MNELTESMNIFYKILKNVYDNYDMKKRNYNILKNIKEIISNNDILEKIININKIKNFKEEILNIVDLYNKIILDDEGLEDLKEIDKVNNNFVKFDKQKEKPNLKEKEDKINKVKKGNFMKSKISINANEHSQKILSNKIRIIYKHHQSRIRIFGDDFVKNNKNNCYLSLEGKQKELCSDLLYDQFKKNNDYLEIKLSITKPFTNISCMFKGCSSLECLPDIFNMDTRDIKDMSHLFEHCTSLKSLSGISSWDTSNVVNMSYMFSECSSLQSLPDISNWNTGNVKDMSFMFNKCNSLESLPDIFNWNMNNISDFTSIFNECKSLKLIPDIKKWNIKKDAIITDMFNRCESLKNMNDFYLWRNSKFNQKTIIYGFNYINTIKIFGEIFVKNNINNCHLLLNGQKKN